MKSFEVELAANEVRKIDSFNSFTYADRLDEIVLHMEVIAGRSLEMTSTKYFVAYKNLRLDVTAKLYIHVSNADNLLVMSTDKFIKNVYISSSKGYIRFTDNYFDMIA
jgi:hypothetical protein